MPRCRQVLSNGTRRAFRLGPAPRSVLGAKRLAGALPALLLLAACRGPAAVDVAATAPAGQWRCEPANEAQWRCRRDDGPWITFARGATETAARPRPAATPAYREHAYAPARPVALIDLPEHYFALQVGTFPSRAAAQRFVDASRLTGLLVVPAARREILAHVVLAGVYADREAAERARDSLPSRVGSMRPWVRRLRSLHTAMRRAEALPGGGAGAPVLVGGERR